MTPFESQRSEPNQGDDVIVCPHIAAGNDVGEMKYRYMNPPTKQITGNGSYLRANWSACCQSCYSEAGGDGDKINFHSVVRWPVPVKKENEGKESRRGVHLKEGEKVVVCEHLDPQRPGLRRDGGGIFWLDGKAGEGRVKRENPMAAAIVLCEKCSPKFSRDIDNVRTAGVGEWKDESGLPPEQANRVGYVEDSQPKTDWPPSDESMKKKATVTDSRGENPKAEFGQEIVPPPPGAKLADSVTDPRRDEEQRYVMSQGGGGLPPVEESPPREPEDFMGDTPEPVEPDENRGVQEGMPNRPGPDDRTDRDLGKGHPNKGHPGKHNKGK